MAAAICVRIMVKQSNGPGTLSLGETGVSTPEEEGVQPAGEADVRPVLRLPVRPAVFPIPAVPAVGSPRI